MATIPMTTRLERVLALRRIPILAALEPDDLDLIASTAVERVYPPGEVIFRDGEQGTEMCVILEGRVAVTKGAGTQRRLVREYGPGDHVGELALLRHAPRAADVSSIDDVRVLAIDRNALESILVDRPEVAQAMLASLADRVAALTPSVDPETGDR